MQEHLLKNPLGVPMNGLLHLHTRRRLRRALARCHHDQRLGYGRVSLGTVVGGRDGWSDGMGMVVDLTWWVQRRRLAWKTRPKRTLIAHRAGLRMYLRASKRESRFQLEWLCDVCGKSLAKCVHLLLHFWHGPHWRACLQNPHVPDKKLPRVTIQLRVRTSDGNLTQLEAATSQSEANPTHQV